ncbi:hypothetical protein IFM89_008693 [Coptis chinensis]|uniref:Serine-threonine/tyrosine-protein kinase catalytic domain-containing protein n=1 Tax=Coptis chinensis TaxID=261450 RepID=A0A835GWU1_9MAGN|nr:hypothetical protein IFM89_008693 [Coptis chinensis]
MMKCSGYMAPEYALHELFSVRYDVFSFGVLLLEIVSGQKKRFTSILSGPSRDLLSYAWKLWREENLEDRPAMSSVVLMLNSYSLTLESPSALAFIIETRTGAQESENNHSTSSSLLYSVDAWSFFCEDKT